MRIGYEGFVDPGAVDILVSPPSGVRYEPQFRYQSVLTTSGLTELRGYSNKQGYAMRIEWQDIPEPELARLAMIPPTEVVTLINEQGREIPVVLNEPVRALQSGKSTFSGHALYTANITAFPVSLTAFSVNRLMEPTATIKNIGTTKPPVSLDRDPAAPVSPTPANYSPINNRAQEGLPPGVTVGEGARFTFATFQDELGSGRYYSTEGDGYFNITYITPQDYEGWYSNVRTGGNTVEVSNLKRFDYDLASEDFTVGMLVWIDSTLTAGTIVEASTDTSVFSISTDDVAGKLRVVWHDYDTYQGLTFSVTKETFVYISAQVTNGTLSVSIDNAAAVTATSSTTVPPSMDWEGVRLGGGNTHVDDLLLVNNGSVDMSAVYDWMLGS